MKIIIDDHIPFLRGLFEPFCDVSYITGTHITRDDLIHADALLVRTRTRCNSELLQGTDVKFIGTATIGTDHIDLQWCRSAGIKVVSAPGCNSMAVNQYIISALLHLSAKHSFNLADKVLGVIGAGHVGSKVSASTEALGMKVLINDPPRERTEGQDGFVSLDKLLGESDIITLHVPLNYKGQDKTCDMASADFFSRIKKGASIINTSRGKVVDEKALYEASQSGMISDYVIDVWRGEPDINNRLLSVATIATPHIAGYSVEGKANAAKAVARAMAGFFNLPLDKWEPDLSSPANRVISTGSFGGSFEKVIHGIVNQTYMITDDDKALRARPGSFEELRNNYQVRHDFSTFNVEGDNKIVVALNKMGFGSQKP